MLQNWKSSDTFKTANGVLDEGSFYTQFRKFFHSVVVADDAMRFQLNKLI